MTRTYRFVQSLGVTGFRQEDGTWIQLPVFPGLFKHVPPGELFGLLQDEAVARKYTRLALQKAAWQILKEFPRDWLLGCLEQTPMREGRRRALRYLLGSPSERARMREGLHR